MKLIVGLGNPDDKYKNTFHNLGFMAVDRVAEKLGVEFSKQKCRALIAEARVGGEKVILAKPLTYMNLSGESVRELLSFFKIDLKDLIVIYDDYDIDKGVVRIRESGSAGTHNGMRNILLNISSEKFARIRIGFKPNSEFKIPLIDYVLSGIKEEDKPLMDKAIEVASNAGVAFSKGEDIQKIMQNFNGKAN
jgi:PTH1 family peptidyl-tRNA hydrolase